MTDLQWELLALRIALVIAVAGALLFVADYTRLTKGQAWRNNIGLTIQLEAVFLTGTLTPLLLAAFWHLSVTASAIGSWILIGFLGLTGLVMVWRTIVFERVKRRDATRTPPGDGTPLPH